MSVCFNSWPETVTRYRSWSKLVSNAPTVDVLIEIVNIQEKVHTGKATQNIHPSLMQNTHIRIQPETPL